MNWVKNMLGTFFRKLGELTPSCREAARLQSAALDQPLRLGPRLGLRIHLALCKWCRRYGHQINFLRAVARHPDATDHSLPPQQLSAAARDRIKHRLHEEKKNRPSD